MDGYIFTDKLIEVCKRIAKKQKISTVSIRKGRGTPVGNVGEVLFKKLFRDRGYDCKIVRDYEYDILLDNNIRVEVKTKEISKKDGRDIKPTLDWDASVSRKNDRQECDYYAFCRVNMNHKKGWFMGMIPKNEFKNKARKLKSGQKDGSNEYVVKQGCLNLAYREMYDDHKSNPISK